MTGTAKVAGKSEGGKCRPAVDFDAAGRPNAATPARGERGGYPPDLAGLTSVIVTPWRVSR
jgi:hypothetical protein